LSAAHFEGALAPDSGSADLAVATSEHQQLQESALPAALVSSRGTMAGNAGPLPAAQFGLPGGGCGPTRGQKDAEAWSAELEEENAALKKQLAEAEQVGAEAMHRLREVQVDREMWKSRCDQMQAQLDQSWSVYEKAQTNWEEAEERVLVVRRCWDRDRRRLREAERFLRELGHPMEPATEDEASQRSPHQSLVGSELSIGGAVAGVSATLGASTCSSDVDGAVLIGGGASSSVIA